MKIWIIGFLLYLLIYQEGYVFVWHVIVCLRNSLKSFGQILMKFSGNVRNGTKNRCFNFAVDPDPLLDPGIFKCLFISRIFDSSYVLSCGHDFKFAV